MRNEHGFTGACPVCGGEEFTSSLILWDELIETWQLSREEVDYINRQQGVCCCQCQNNLRALALSAAILREYDYNGTLTQFCESSIDLKILEINPAGNLTKILQKLPGHKLVEYPQFDMTNLAIGSGFYDLVVHSDTLEHVPLPERGLSECFRVLNKHGRCIFTVPVIVDRFTRNRTGLKASYHGRSDVPAQDQLVYNEFGVDIWKTVIKSGFSSCEIFSFEYPSALTIIAKKDPR